MTTLEVVNIHNSKVGDVEVSDDIFAASARLYLLTEIVHWQRAKKRSSCQSTLAKGEVKGSVKKPFSQKGRGSARQGTMKNPHQIGGGVAFAPKPRDYSYKIPRAKRRAALATALSVRVREGRLIVLDNFTVVKGSSALVQEVVNRFALGRILIVDCDNTELKRGARNLKNVKYLHEMGINVYDILYFEHLILTKNALKTIENRLLGVNSRIIRLKRVEGSSYEDNI